MMHMQPCHYCPLKADCAIRDGHRARLKGSGIAFVRFTCSTFENEFRPGRRVLATITAGRVVRSWHDGEDHEDVTVPATVIAYRRDSRKVLIWPDDDQHDALDNMKHEKRFAKLSPAKLRPLSEPDNLARVKEFEAWGVAQDALSASEFT